MKNSWVSKLLILVLCALSLPSFAGAKAKTIASEQSIDKIMATVNDDVITQNELNLALRNVKAQMTANGIPLPPEKTLVKQVLNQLVNRKLELQLASQAGMTATEESVDQAIAKIAKDNNISTSTLYSKIQEEGLTRETYRNEIREEMTIQQVQRQEVASRIVISPQELETFSRSQSWQKNTGKEYHLEDILIALPDAPSTQDINTAAQRAASILAKLRQGQTYNAIATAEPGAPNSLQNGDLGWRQLPEVPSAFAQEITKMKVNDYIGPIQAPNGFHIIHLADMRALKSKRSGLAKNEIQEMLFQRKFEESLQNWLSKLRSQAFVELNVS